MIPHPPSCPCPHCRIAQTHARMEANEAAKAIPERPVHWRWLHGPTPPDQQESPRELADRRYHASWRTA